MLWAYLPVEWPRSVSNVSRWFVKMLAVSFSSSARPAQHFIFGEGPIGLPYRFDLDRLNVMISIFLVEALQNKMTQAFFPGNTV